MAESAGCDVNTRAAHAAYINAARIRMQSDRELTASIVGGRESPDWGAAVWVPGQELLLRLEWEGGWKQ
jgi:hypothetical protein